MSSRGTHYCCLQTDSENATFRVLQSGSFPHTTCYNSSSTDGDTNANVPRFSERVSRFRWLQTSSIFRHILHSQQAGILCVADGTGFVPNTFDAFFPLSQAQKSNPRSAKIYTPAPSAKQRGGKISPPGSFASTQPQPLCLVNSKTLKDTACTHAYYCSIYSVHMKHQGPTIYTAQKPEQGKQMYHKTEPGLRKYNRKQLEKTRQTMVYTSYMKICEVHLSRIPGQRCRCW